MTKYPQLFAALAAPFPSEMVKVRQQAGRSLSYITARTAMNRLDQVLGPENWWDEYTPGEHSVLCKLTIVLPDGTTLTKSDAGGYAGMSDQGDDDKIGYSDAFKRAAVKFGVSRYLYRDGVPDFVREHCADFDAYQGESAPPPRQQSYDRPPHYDRPPQRQQYDEPPRQQQRPPQQNGGGGRQYDGPPKSGRAMFAWTKNQEAEGHQGLLEWLNKWGKLQDFPGRMVDWDADQVVSAYQEAMNKINSADQRPAY